MRKIISFIALILPFVMLAQGGGSQQRHSNAASRSELGFFGGGASYLGDVNPSNPFREINAAIGLVYRYNLNTRFVFRANVGFMRINASDSKSKEAFLRNRNLNFRNDIFEVGAGIELNFFKYRPEDLFYHRVGMRYVFDNGINMNLVLKSHWARADYVEYGIGYTFKR